MKLLKKLLQFTKYYKDKELKDLCNQYEEEHKTTFETWVKDIQKIDKAIEYIKEKAYLVQDKEINGIPLMSYRLDTCYDLLEILGDKENE